MCGGVGGCVWVCVGWSQTVAQGRIKLPRVGWTGKAWLGPGREVLMESAHLWGRPGLELMFGSWCRGKCTDCGQHL